MARPRTALVVLVALLPLGLVAACGESGSSSVGPGGGSDVSPESAASASASASASPTARATKRVSSGLESQAPVEAARAWAAAVASEVNERSSAHAQTRAVSTARGARTLPKLYADDYGLRYPGPLPFTPLSVSVAGRTAKVPVCVQAQGWAVQPDGVSPRDTVLRAQTFVLKRVRGDWRMDAVTGRDESCNDVTVKGSAS